MNNVELELMGLFATVVEQGSFTGAAEALGMPKSSVSQKISRLETQLGVRLLQRTTRRLSLTPQGEIYVEQCQALLALVLLACQLMLGVLLLQLSLEVFDGIATGVELGFLRRGVDFHQ